MLPLGTAAPPFALPDVSTGDMVTLQSFSGKRGLLVMFICRHCPYVKHVQSELAKLGRDYLSQPIGMVAISSNDAKAYPDDGPESLAEMVTEQGFVFPLCFDESQDVARAYQAVCTPEFYLFDADRKLVYRGQFDNSRPRTDIPVSGCDVRNALEALLRGEAISPDQKPSLGCNIKWRESPQ